MRVCSAVCSTTTLCLLTITTFVGCTHSPVSTHRGTVLSHLRARHTARSRGQRRPRTPHFRRKPSAAVLVPVLRRHFNSDSPADIATLGLTIVARCGEDGSLRRPVPVEQAIKELQADSQLRWEKSTGRWELLCSRPSCCPLSPPPLPPAAHLLSRCVKLPVVCKCCSPHTHAT